MQLVEMFLSTCPDVPILRSLLKKMIELSPECVDLEDGYANTPLHWACSEGHTEVASALICDHGANLDAV